MSSGIPTTIRHARITGNTVSAFDPNGEPAAFDAAMLVEDSPLTMDDTVISGNDVRATYASSEDVGIGGTTLEVDGGGIITNSRITDNTAEGFSRDGVAAVSNGLSVLNFSDEPATTPSGGEQRHRRQPRRGTQRKRLGADRGRRCLQQQPARAAARRGHSKLRRRIRPWRARSGWWNLERRRAVRTARGAHAQGIRDQPQLAHRKPLGSALDGGGVFATEPITRIRTSITDNQPNQCAGC